MDCSVGCAEVVVCQYRGLTPRNGDFADARERDGEGNRDQYLFHPSPKIKIAIGF